MDRYIANRYLIANPKSNLDVEWAYCFDVHLNAVLPLLTILHIGQLPFLNCKSKLCFTNWSNVWHSPLSLAFAVNTGFFYCLFGNTVWAIATGYYVYILFLGFSGMLRLNFNRLRFSFRFCFSTSISSQCPCAFVPIDGTFSRLYSFNSCTMEFHSNDRDILRISCGS